MDGGAFLWGWDGSAAWKKVRTDSDGHLQVDVLSGVGVASQCYGYDGSAWQTLLVESDTLKNLRVKLYDGANSIDSLTVAATQANPRGLATSAQIYGYDGATNTRSPYCRLFNEDALVTGYYGLYTATFLHGFNGSTWDRLRTESASAFNLRVKLYSGAYGISATAAESKPSLDSYVLDTHALLLAWSAGEAEWVGPRADIPADGFSPSYSLIAYSFLAGFNGTTFDRIRISASDSIMTKEETSNPQTSGRITTSSLLYSSSCHIYGVTINKSNASAVVVKLKNGLDASAPTVWEVRVTGLRPWSKNFWPWIAHSEGIYVDIIGNVYSVIVEFGDMT